MSFFAKLVGRKAAPDFYFAAKGFVQVAVTRRQGKDELFLRRLERGHAIELLNEGCSQHQAMSARWGGCLAIEDDLALFDAAIRHGRYEAAELKRLPADAEMSKAIYRTLYQQAGDFAVRAVWESDRSIYRRFLDAVA